MPFITNVKRAAADYGLYKGTFDENWQPSYQVMYMRLCNRFNGLYTPFPQRADQPKSFLEFVDKYEDPDYNKDHVEAKPEPKKELPPEGGRNLKELIPERLPVNTQEVSRQEAQNRHDMVNRNVLNIDDMNKAPAPTPEEALKNEQPTESLGDGSNVKVNKDEGNEPAKSDTVQQSNGEEGATKNDSDGSQDSEVSKNDTERRITPDDSKPQDNSNNEGTGQANKAGATEQKPAAQNTAGASGATGERTFGKTNRQAGNATRHGNNQTGSKSVNPNKVTVR